MTDSVYQAAAARTPELVHAWPTRAWGGQVVSAYRLTDEFSLLIIRPNGGQMPSCDEQLPQPLSVPDFLIHDRLDVFEIAEWARASFRLGPRDSVFVVPAIRAPSNESDFRSVPQIVQDAMNNQIGAEFERIAGVLRGYITKVTPPRTLVNKGTIHGDMVGGDKITIEKG